MGIEISNGETVIHHIWYAGPRNAYNQPTDAYTSQPIQGVGVDDTHSIENSIGGGEQAQTDLIIFLPEGSSVYKKDQFTIRGKRYKVNGHAEPLKNFFTGTVFKTEVRLERVDG